MTYARVPNFSEPVPVRRDRARAGAGRQSADDRYLNLPAETLPGSIEPWEAVAPVRPDTAHSRALRFLNATGEALTAVAIIAGGILAYGYLPTV